MSEDFDDLVRCIAGMKEYSIDGGKRIALLRARLHKCRNNDYRFLFELHEKRGHSSTTVALTTERSARRRSAFTRARLSFGVSETLACASFALTSSPS